MNKSKGFTLIEIIVVLIILGVLAAIALPNIFMWIERSRSAEGVVFLKSLNDQMQACVLIKDVNTCSDNLTAQAPVTTHFSMNSPIPFSVPYPMWLIVILRNNVDRPVLDPGGSVVCSGGGGVATYTNPGVSSIGLCHNIDGDGANQVIGSGYYQGVF